MHAHNAAIAIAIPIVTPTAIAMGNSEFLIIPDLQFCVAFSTHFIPGISCLG